MSPTPSVVEKRLDERFVHGSVVEVRSHCEHKLSDNLQTEAVTPLSDVTGLVPLDSEQLQFSQRAAKHQTVLKTLGVVCYSCQEASPSTVQTTVFSNPNQVVFVSKLKQNIRDFLL